MSGRPRRSSPIRATATVLTELVAHLRQNRTQLREEWVHRITGAKLLTAMSREDSRCRR